MTDWLLFPTEITGPLAKASRVSPAVRWWLWITAGLVFAMVVVGGATRLTESGLSITEWKPVTGILPPLNLADWQAEFEKYRKIPQYAQLFPDMDMGRFQFIYFWEWGHRLLGRVIGLVFAVPLLWFAITRQLPGGWFAAKLAGLLALGGLQGFVGWWMVKSGLSERVEVSQYRLAVHLVLAALTFAALIWLAASLGQRRAQPGQGTLRPLASGLVAVVLLQIGLGALVAGLRGGLTYNSWPLMDGHFVPPYADLTRLSPLWSNVFENITAVQFQHRMAAYALLGLALWQAAVAFRLGGRAWRRALAITGLVLCQAGLGIATLLLAVPLWAGLAHQALAMIVLAMAVVNRQALSE